MAASEILNNHDEHNSWVLAAADVDSDAVCCLILPDKPTYILFLLQDLSDREDHDNRQREEEAKKHKKEVRVFSYLTGFS
jgi:hypothetical protein